MEVHRDSVGRPPYESSWDLPVPVGRRPDPVPDGAHVPAAAPAPAFHVRHPLLTRLPVSRHLQLLGGAQKLLACRAS